MNTQNPEMQKTDIVWRTDGEWKTRYSKLYSSRRLSQPMEDQSRRISFMGQEPAPNRTLLMRIHTRRNSSLYGETLPGVGSTSDINTLLSQRSESYFSYPNTLNMSSAERNDSPKDTDTLLLEMVRAKSREMEEAQDKTLALQQDDVSEDQSSEACVHGLSMRMTDRSISRRSMSRISRVSTRRDMDIPSILAFTATVAPAPAPLGIPAFQKVNSALDQSVPKFSIRRSICPVCSQKWRDKSSISNIKYSGLKRNSSAELPTVMAPARLRSAITREYTPRPILAAVDENKYVGCMRNSSASWLLTRARRFRTPKLQMPSPEAAAPPISTAPMAIKDLDTRVNRFLTDEGMNKYLINAGYVYPK
ncbi:unnamed protein product [Arctia plantaginis]|uniref:Uncharacterized protein n=1 Tax=Arctia plantaginis TaxID=874455 RepID=A0A8S1B4K5_ARCPL|nr:unnamed protein product [Arctia plantaginis]CAB3253317.1 unnamed protein product [Arctia plantaginis]